MHRSTSLHLAATLCLALLTAGAFLGGCKHKERDALTPPPLDPVKAELEDTRNKLRDAEISAAAKQSELNKAAAALEAARIERIEKDQVIVQRDAQIKVVQTELDALKKRDAFVFADIRLLHEQGRFTVALGRYQQFLKDFPNSPFAALATNAIAELTTESQREAQWQAEVFDPRRRERETMRLITTGLLTPRELAPMLRGRNRTEVLSLLGRPDNVLPDGNEIGYSDRVTNPATGKKGMLIVTFESGTVAALRIDYAGQKYTP